jgi:hypothetical protein
MISGIRRGVHEIWRCSGILRSEEFFLDCLTLEDWPDRLSRNVGYNLSTLRKVPEERRYSMWVDYSCVARHYVILSTLL